MPAWLVATAAVSGMLPGAGARASDAVRSDSVGHPAAEVQTADVDRFFAVFDAADGRPSAADLQWGYLDPGSPGLQAFVVSRIGSADRLAAAIATDPALFEDARRCASALPEIRTRVQAALGRLAEVYPSARFPPVTILVGRGSSGGVTTPEGVAIGLETLCRADWMQPDIGERFVHLIAHEYVHVQQPGAAVEAEAPTLLYQVLLEGGAEFVGELISGQVANAHLHAWAHGRECAIEREFVASLDDRDWSRWLYNGPGDAERPGDLGYWVGYRIAAAWYGRAEDKQHAIAQLLQVRPETAPRLLEHSGWRPECPAG